MVRWKCGQLSTEVWKIFLEHYFTIAVIQERKMSIKCRVPVGRRKKRGDRSLRKPSLRGGI